MAKSNKNPHAVKLGKLGGKAISRRGSEYFRQLQAKRKDRKGGRPRADRGEL